MEKVGKQNLISTPNLIKSRKDIFIISDTHFSHSNILKFTNSEGNKIRPEFSSVSEMDWGMVDRWNSVVKPGDKVYHLGDVYMSASKGYIENLLSKLQGQKRLILGNHDNGRDQILQKFFKKIDVWRKFTEFGLLLTHVPVHESVLGEGRFNGKKMVNVHGHIHANKSPPGPYRCVCVEQVSYTPVNIEELRII